MPADNGDSFEQFIAQLTAISPPRWPSCLEGLARMAEYAVTATEALASAVMDYVRALCQPTELHSITAEVVRIRHLESESDRARDEVVEQAFRGGPSATALVYLQLATQLDSAIDVIEDVTDQLLSITGNQDWIRIEPDASA